MRSHAVVLRSCLAIVSFVLGANNDVRALQAVSASQHAAPQDAISGTWLVTSDVFGNPLYETMTLKLENGKLTGTFSGDKLEGSLSGNLFHFIARDEQNNTEECTGTVSGDTLRTSIFAGFS